MPSKKPAKKPDEETTTLEPLPSDLEKQFRALLGSEEEIKVAVSTDLRFDGTYGQDWVLVTDKRLVAFNQNGAPDSDVQNIPFNQVEGIEVRSLQGNSFLKVRTPDKTVEIARFSNKFAPKFAEATPQIESLIQQVKPEIEETQKRRRGGPSEKPKGKCETCGRALPPRSGVCPNCIEKRKLIFRLLKYGIPDWRVSVPAFLIMLAVRFAGIYPMVLGQKLIDKVFVPAITAIEAQNPVAPGAFGLLVSIVLLMIGLNVFTTVFSSIRGYMMTWVGQRITLRLRNEAYEHLNMLSLDFYNQHDTGNLMSRVTHDIGRLRSFIAEGLQEILGDSVTLIFMFIIMFHYSWKLTLWAMIPVPCLIFFTIFFGKKMHKVFRSLWKRYADISTTLASTIPGMRVVKAFTREKYEVERFNAQSQHLFEGEMSGAKLWTTYQPIMQFLTFSATIIIWLVGGRQILNADLSLGILTMFMGFMLRFLGPVQTLCNMNRRFLEAATSAERVFEILDTPPSVADSDGAINHDSIRGGVEFRDVYFSYDDEKNAVDGISFAVKPGEMIGLVGHSGAGKSTLINLITRFYDPQEGEILIDGHRTRNITLRSLRRQIGVVLQDPFPVSRNRVR